MDPFAMWVAGLLAPVVIPVSFVLLFVGLVSVSVAFVIRERKWSAFRRIFVAQAAIDAMLAQLAKSLDAAFRNQIRQQSPVGRVNVSDAEVELALARVRVDDAKAEFWHAVELAQKAGYKVPTSYKDVLGKPLIALVQ